MLSVTVSAVRVFFLSFLKHKKANYYRVEAVQIEDNNNI